MGSLAADLGVLRKTMTAEWFRNARWNESVERSFNEKLRRARRKEQYLRIQASTLACSHPEVALRLLDRYFELPDDFDHAQAHVDRATALLALHESRLTFPVDHFRWHSARALIAGDAQERDVAKVHAGRALEAASRDNSGFRYHRSLGLVTGQYDGVIKTLEALCS